MLLRFSSRFGWLCHHWIYKLHFSRSLRERSNYMRDGICLLWLLICTANFCLSCSPTWVLAPKSKLLLWWVSWRWQKNAQNLHWSLLNWRWWRREACLGGCSGWYWFCWWGAGVWFWFWDGLIHRWLRNYLNLICFWAVLGHSSDHGRYSFIFLRFSTFSSTSGYPFYSSLCSFPCWSCSCSLGSCCFPVSLHINFSIWRG